MSSSANLQSGNLYHSQNAGGLDLTYNSLDPYSGPIGKGWTHDYNMTISSQGQDKLSLKIGDGNKLYFQLSNGIYYPETRTGDTSTIVINTDGTYTRALKDGTINEFSIAGKLTQIKNRNGNTTTLAYSGNDLASITDSSGRTSTITSSSGKITSITDSGGGSYVLAYSGNFLSSITDPEGGQWQFTYDANGRMLSKSDPLANLSAYTYDTNGMLISSQDAELKEKSLSYDQVYNKAYVTEKDGSVWIHEYDGAKNLPLKITDPTGNVKSFTYNSKRNLLSETEPDGSTTSYTYDSSGNKTSVTDPSGSVTSYTYNSFGQVTSMTDARNNVTTYTYDDRGNLITTAYPGGATVQSQYDLKNNLISTTNANNQTTSFTYDQYNNLISTTDPMGTVTTFIYDAAGNMTQQIDAQGGISIFEYNKLNKLTAMIDPLDNVTTYTYDANGNRTSITDANGNITTHEYNFRGQVTRTIDAAGKITTFTYGDTGNPSCGGAADKISSITDAKGNTTLYKYDTLSRMTQETDPLGYTTSYSYDTRGNLTSKTDANGNTMTYSYDATGRLTQKTYPDGSVDAFQYDVKGNMTYAGNQHIAYSYVYDSRDRVTSVTDSNSRTIQYTYDNNSNRLTMADPIGRTMQYAYNPLNLVTSIQNNSNILSFTYDNIGRRTELSYPNGLKNTYAYDQAGRLSNLALLTPSEMALTSTTYGYDKYGNRTSIVNTPSTEDMPMRPVEQYITGAGNRLLEDGTYTYTYDNNGNLITKTKKTSGEMTDYYWDGENRLIRVEIAGTVLAQYRYDPFGRRIEKNVNGVITKYLYDNEDILFEYDQSGNIIRAYINGPGIDEPLTVNSNGSTYFYHANGLGSIEAITDNSGTVVQRNVYDDFGAVRNKYINGTPPVQPYAFTAREYDEETGMYYYRARYYDPKVGKFISQDPIGFDGGTVNLFEYVGNNPVNQIDPMGLSPKFPYTPPSGCEYYKKKCEEEKCDKDKDDYACKVYKCCQAFGEDPTSNCIRGCLIEFDKRNCANLTGEARNRCRRLAHWDCYDRCLGHGKGAGGLLFGPPAACQDAMKAVGGMGF